MRGHRDLVFTLEFIYVLLLYQFAEIALVIVFVSTVTPNISLQAVILFFYELLFFLSRNSTYGWDGANANEGGRSALKSWLFQFGSYYCHNQGFVQRLCHMKWHEEFASGNDQELNGSSEIIPVV